MAYSPTLPDRAETIPAALPEARARAARLDSILETPTRVPMRSAMLVDGQVAKVGPGLLDATALRALQAHLQI